MMKDDFESLSQSLFSERKSSEHIILNLRGETSDFVRVNQSRVRQIGSVSEIQLSLDYLLQTPMGLKKSSRSLSLTGNLADDKARLKRELDLAREETLLLPVDPYAELPQIFESSSSCRRGDLLRPEEIGLKILTPLKEWDAAGLYAGGKIMRGFSHSEGLRHWFETENFSWDYSVYTPQQRAIKKTLAGSQWSDEAFSFQVHDLRQSLEVLTRPSIKLKRGSYRVYLAPAAVNELLGMLSWGCVGEASMRNAESPLLKLRAGEASFSDKVSLYEDFSNGFVPRFNSEGELSPECLTIIEKGQLKSSLVSRRSAKEFGIQSTGATPSEGLRSPRLAKGNLSEESILKTLGSGLYLSNLHYLNWSDQPAGRVTGMTRFSCFWVEDGKLTAPIETMRFDDTLFSIFGSAIEDLTHASHWLADTGTYDMRSLGGAETPGLLLRDFMLTI